VDTPIYRLDHHRSEPVPGLGYREINACRISGSTNLLTILDLGEQALTGVFPKSSSEHVTTGPLKLLWCPDSGLVQLSCSYDGSEMYGANYGYRSGLNQSMVRHLQQKAAHLQIVSNLVAGDVVLDIGSNDATLLKSYTVPSLQRIGIDPTGEKFKQYYPADITLLPEFFSARVYRLTNAPQANIVTSIAMFYDLEDPLQFARDVEAILAPGGIWHFEQSYLPSMLRMTSYDTVCHEHLEYYSLTVVQKILAEAGLQIADVKMNAVNGGSFAVTAIRASDKRKRGDAVVNWLLEQEDRMGLNTPKPYREFEERVFRHRADLVRLLKSLNADGKSVVGYGASTKGNAVLQFCGLGTSEIKAIAEVNPDKFGSVTPGTNIPIISEVEARARKPDYFLVMPWHFKDGIIAREAEFLAAGGNMIFPFPEIEIV
jgi:hypothetical protein